MFILKLSGIQNMFLNYMVSNYNFHLLTSCKKRQRKREKKKIKEKDRIKGVRTGGKRREKPDIEYR